jgi:hypothetical protein
VDSDWAVSLSSKTASRAVSCPAEPRGATSMAAPESGVYSALSEDIVDLGSRGVRRAGWGFETV